MLLQLHLHSRLDAWFHWIGQRQLQDESRNIQVWGFGVSYIRDFTATLLVVKPEHSKIPTPISGLLMPLLFGLTSHQQQDNWICRIKASLSFRSKATFTYAQSGCGVQTGGFWHSCSATVGMFTHTRSGRGRICHFFRTKMVWSAWFWSGCRKLGFWSHLLRSRFCSHSATAYVWMPVMICVDANFLLAYAPRMCERTLRISTTCATSVLRNDQYILTHCGLETSYGDRDLGQHWLR